MLNFEFMNLKKYLFFIGMLTILLTIGSCSNEFNKILRSKDIDLKLKKADYYFDKKKYELAQTLYENVFPFIKGTPRYEEYYFKFGLSYFLNKDYLNAENLFKTYSENFSEGKHAEEADFFRAECYMKQSPKPDLDQTNTLKSINLFQAFIFRWSNSQRITEASDNIEKLRLKLEIKDKNNALLYYNIGLYRASSVSFLALSDRYPDSKSADEYKYWVIKSLFNYAKISLPEKQEERYTKALTEIKDFEERFQDSKLMPLVLQFKEQSINNKIINNEQIQKTL